MNSLLRHGLMPLMLVFIGLSYGCAKPQLPVETPPLYRGAPGGVYAAGPYDGVSRQMTAEELAASAVITEAKIYFDYDRFDLSAESKRILAAKADVLKKFAQFRVTIEGHCDERGTDEYNMALGERRARAAYEYLTLLGVNPMQLDMVSMGRLHPVVTGHSEASWRMNRRCEFKVALTR